jgi:integrase
VTGEKSRAASSSNEQLIISRDGAIVDISKDAWIVRGSVNQFYFSFSRFRSFASHELIESVKAVTSIYIQRHSLSHANSLFNRFWAFCRFAGIKEPITQIETSAILSYRASLGRSREWYVSALRGFFRTWFEMNLGGLSYDVIRILDDMSIKGNEKGRAVATSNKNNGPFTDLELKAIVDGLHTSFANEGMSHEDYVLANLFIVLGARPVQIALLKVSDFSSVYASDGSRTSILRVPRAKVRHAGTRTQFKARRLTKEIGELVEAQCQRVRSQFGKLSHDSDDLAMFPSPENQLDVPEIEGHCTASELSRRVISVFRTIDSVSERTGVKIYVTASRFRRTLGTRAAREGLNELVIAELLDHSDTQNVGVYVEAVPQIVERIDKGMAMQLAPLAQAFDGALIDSEASATRAGDPRSRIVTPDDLSRPVGSCGSYGFCGALAPVACYTCRNFQPWVDGPHERILDQLVAERERIVSETGDLTIASVNDRVILACAEVVRLCRERTSRGVR